jgi:hypothetical protein
MLTMTKIKGIHDKQLTEVKALLNDILEDEMLENVHGTGGGLDKLTGINRILDTISSVHRTGGDIHGLVTEIKILVDTISSVHRTGGDIHGLVTEIKTQLDTISSVHGGGDDINK